MSVRLVPEAAIRAPLHLDLEIVGSYISATQTSVGFVQIGAFDGVTNDPLHDLIRRFGWRGVLVEPQPHIFARLSETYADVADVVLINAAVAKEAGTLTLWRIGGSDPEDLPWMEQIASFDRDHVLRHLGAYPAVAERIVSESVTAVTLPEVFAQAPVRVDVIQIDAEGYDAELVKMLNLDAAPRVVRFEHCNLDAAEHRAAISRLVSHGYRIAIGEDDTIAMRHWPGRGSTATI